MNKFGLAALAAGFAMLAGCSTIDSAVTSVKDAAKAGMDAEAKAKIAEQTAAEAMLKSDEKSEKAKKKGPVRTEPVKACHVVTDARVIELNPAEFKEDFKLACNGGKSKLCDVRMYQIMTESFRHGDKGASGYGIAWGPSDHKGNLRGVIDSLDYIKSMNFNAIWLTPIFMSKADANQDMFADRLDGTGYFATDYFKIDPKFGTLEELKELTQKAHKMGIAVILDVALGHSKANVITKSPKGNELVTRKRCRDAWGQFDKPGSNFICSDPGPSMAFINEFINYWMDTAKVDGWRFDQMYQFEPEHWKVITATIEKAAKRNKTLGYSVGEMWTNKPKYIQDFAFKDGNMTSAFNFPLRHQLTKVLATHDDAFQADSCGQPASTLQAAYSDMAIYDKTAMPNMFLGNHDFLRFGDLIQRAGFSEDGLNNESYYRRHKAALSFIASASGPITVYYNEEIGADLLDFIDQPGNCGDVCLCDDHVARTTGKFSNFTPYEKDLKEYVSAIMKLRAIHPALSRGTRTGVYSDSTVYAELKSSGSEQILYILNAADAKATFKVADGFWKSLNGSSQCTLTDLVTGDKSDGKTIEVGGLSGTFFKLKCSK